MRGAGVDTTLYNRYEFFLVVGNAAAGAAKRKRWADNCRIAHHRLHLQRFFQRMRKCRARAIKANLRHRLFKFFAVFGFVDGFFGSANHLHAVFFQHAVLGEIKRAVQRGLSAHRRQQSIGLFNRNDFFDHLPGNRLDVRGIRHAGVGHDGGRV